jgi:hypothetical protein
MRRGGRRKHLPNYDIFATLILVALTGIEPVYQVLETCVLTARR